MDNIDKSCRFYFCVLFFVSIFVLNGGHHDRMVQNKT